MHQHHENRHNDRDNQFAGNDPQRMTAAARAEAGTGEWEAAVRLQRWAPPDHADWYALAAEIVTTLHAFDDLAQVLRRQVASYPTHVDGRGRRVYDDTREVDPQQRLRTATTALDQLRGAAGSAEAWANTFWSAIGHIGTEDATGDATDDATGDAELVEGRDDSVDDGEGATS